MRALQHGLLLAYRGLRRTGAFDTRLGRRLFEAAYWTYKSLIEASEIRTLRPYVERDSTVVDVGANIGFFTVPFARWVGPGGTVIAIEPEARNFDSLRARVTRLGLGGSVFLVDAAAVDTAGQVRLALNPDHPGDHHVAVDGVPVAAVTVDDLVRRRGSPRVCLVKVDVQGSELRVIRGARETLRRCKPALFIEFDELRLVAAGTNSRELMEEIAGAGYLPHSRSRAGAWRPIDAADVKIEMVRRGYVDVLFVHPEGGCP
jgi:FkbM family methyltransferase